MPYTFDFEDAGGHIGHLQLWLCASDLEAMREAEAALRENWTARAVEVWCDTARIGRIEGQPHRWTPAAGARRLTDAANS